MSDTALTVNSDITAKFCAKLSADPPIRIGSCGDRMYGANIYYGFVRQVSIFVRQCQWVDKVACG